VRLDLGDDVLEQSVAGRVSPEIVRCFEVDNVDVGGNQ